MIAFSGVLSSCDMLARNSDFMRLACFQLDVFLLQRLLEAFIISSVTSRAAANTPCRRLSRDSRY
jgi:hypothetical protein